MPGLTIFDSFVEDLAEKKHDLGADTLTIALCAAANVPLVTNTILSNLTQIAYTSLSSRTVVRVSSSQTAGIYRLMLQDLVLTASGTVATFRYVVLYNDTTATDLLIGFYDHGANVTLLNGETFTINFDGVNGAISLV